MPVLEMLYHASKRTPNQIYMLLIILLVLSQDASFNANVHKLVTRPHIPITITIAIPDSESDSIRIYFSFGLLLTSTNLIQI